MSTGQVAEMTALFLDALAERVRKPSRMPGLADKLLRLSGGDPCWQARAEILRGWGQTYCGGFARAEAIAVQSAATLQARSDTSGLAAARDLLATCALVAGRFAEALEILAPTLELPASARTPIEWCVTYTRLSNLQERMGQFEEALRWHYRAVAAARESGDAAIQAITLGGLGGLQLSLRNMEDAAALLESAWDIVGTGGREWLHTWSVVAINRTMVLTLQNRLAEALPLADLIADAEPELPAGMRPKRKLLLGHLYARAGQLERAQRCLDEAITGSRLHNAPWIEWVYVQAMVWNRAGRHADVLRICEAHFAAEAAGRLPEAPMPDDLLSLYNELTTAHEALGNLGAALHAQRALLDAEREMVSVAARAQRATLQVKFELESAQRDRDEARRREQAAEREQARLADLNTALQRANEAKTRFLAAASHDLRQPVQALTMYMAALRLETDAGRRSGLTDRMEQSLHALSGMFDVLLDVSRLDAGLVTVNPAPLRLDDLLERLLEEYRWRADERGLGLRLRLPAHDAGAAVTLSDAALLERCLRNLMDNALKYTAGGGVVVRLRAAGPEPAGWRIEVRDTGPGIAADMQSRVFEEFFQIGNEERDRAKGLGLGLSIVRRVAGLLGHPLTLRSSPGRGSCFALELPRLRQAQLRAAPKAARRELHAGLTIAVIDDDAQVRESLASLLERWGCRVLLGADAPEVLARWRLARRPRLDGALVDLRLRGGASGLSAIGHLRQHIAPELPALVLTGDIAPDRLSQLADAAQPWLAKPVLPMRLRSWLNSLAPPAGATGSGRRGPDRVPAGAVS